MRYWPSLLILLLCTGCGPALSSNDLGTVVFEIPKVAGADKPYEMPRLGPPVERSKRHEDPDS